MSAQPSMYRQAMGPAYERLHPALQRFHALADRHALSGEVRIEAPASLLARLLALFTGTPRQDTQGAIRFELEAAPQRERWTRHFPGFRMASTLHLQGTHIVERLGPATLHFTLVEHEGALSMDLQRMRFLGVPCPKFLMPRIRAFERGDGDRLCFEIRADVPGLGKVVHYTGHLAVPQALGE